MKKTLLTLVCAAITSLYTTPLFAAVGDIFYENLPTTGRFTFIITSEDEKTVQLGNGTSRAYAAGTETNIEIPATVRKGAVYYTVTRIADNAFRLYSSLESITIPNTIKSVGFEAFRGCKYLTGIYTTDFQKWCEIDFDGDYANPLKYTNNLYVNGTLIASTDLEIPDGTTKIGSYAFYGRLNTNKVSIPETVTSIGRGAFRSSSITEIEIAEGADLEEIGDSAFYGCKNLATLSIYGNVKAIGFEAIRVCNNISRINIKSLKDWCQTDFDGEYANPFKYCNNLYVDGGSVGATLAIPNGTEWIGSYAFANKTGITKFSIPASVTNIHRNAFRNAAVSEVEIAEGADLEEIGDSAFYNCSNLATLSIYGNVKAIGYEAIRSCNNINRINIKSLKDWCQTDFNGVYANPLRYTNKMYLIDGTETQITALNIPIGTTWIGTYAFYNGAEFSSISIPTTVTRIADHAFLSCTAVESLEIAEGTEDVEIGEAAFMTNSSLQTVFIPGNVTLIKIDAFRQCNNLVSVTTTDIQKWSEGIIFENQQSNPLYYTPNLYLDGETDPITTLALPDGTKRVNAYAFYNCKNLTTITLPATIEEIGNYAFNNNINVTDVYCEGEPATIAEESSSVFGTSQNDVRYTAVFHTPINLLAAYNTATRWKTVRNYASELKESDGDFANEGTFSGRTNNIKIDYQRTFKNTNWQALYVPFDMKYDDFYENFDVAMITGSENSSIKMVYLETGDVVSAGVPYFIKAKTADKDNAQTITASVTTLVSKDEEGSTDFGDYTFTGIYKSTTIPNGSYALASGTLRRAGSNSSALGAYRWYMTPKDANVKATVISLIYDEDYETAINKIAEVAEEGEWYSLSGQRIAQPTKRGIYIKNGKKIMF